MILIGHYGSPFTRRVAVSLRLLGFACEQRPLSPSGDAAQVRAYNPLGRIPALVLDDGETLIDSTAILDHLDQVAGPDRALVPPAGGDRRQVLRLTALALGTMEKAFAVFVESRMRPAEKVVQSWLDRCAGQTAEGFAALEAVLADAPAGGWLWGGRITQADVTAVCAFDFLERIAPERIVPDALPRFGALVRQANALPAFAETRP